MMTHKHFVLIANALREDAAHIHRTERKEYDQMTDWEKGAYDQWNTLVLNMADALATQNERFDRERFIAACKGEHQTRRDVAR